MINQLDEMLRHLLDSELTTTPGGPPIDVAVRPPDDSWRAAVNASGNPAVNVYLVEVREARDQRTSGAVDRADPEPFKVDCHYLISAWIPSADPNVATPTVVEDWLLGESIRVIADAAPLNAASIFGSPLPPQVDPTLEDVDMPTKLLPPEGYPNLADFWTGMGHGNTWHPAAHVVVTLPIRRRTRALAPPVRALRVATGVGGDAEDSLVLIGGTVRDSSGHGIPGATVELLDASATSTVATATSDGAGRFTFARLPAATYQLSARTSTAAAPLQPATVPGNGTFDIDIL